MTRASRLSEVQYQKNSVVTVGSFDGVHLAHRKVIEEVLERARARKGRSVLLTFEPHPKEVLSGRPVHLLTTLEERQAVCEELGVDLFFVVEFTYEFSRQTSREFLVRYIIQGTGVSEVIEGYDHHFGRDREGSIEELVRLGKEFEFSVVAMKPVYVEEEVVSSSRIRQHLLDGRVDRVERLLGRPYSYSGKVVRGDGRGRSLGFPTANIQPSSVRKMVPGDGIYFARVDLGDEMRFGMVSVGVRPTFTADGQRIVETNILEFDGDLYGRTITIQFLKRLRDEMKFGSVDLLVEQMHRDKIESLNLVRVYTLESKRDARQKTSDYPRR
jgi:riboflavin kinase/FMN adenylyltransferase